MITALRSAPRRASFSASASTVARRFEGSPSGMGITCGLKPLEVSERTSFAPQRLRTGGTVTTNIWLAWGSNSLRTDPARVSRPFSMRAWYGRGGT